MTAPTTRRLAEMDAAKKSEAAHRIDELRSVILRAEEHPADYPNGVSAEEQEYNRLCALLEEQAMRNVYDYSECDEIAHCMAINMDPPRFAALDEASAWVKAQMPDETMTIRASVAEALFSAQR